MNINELKLLKLECISDKIEDYYFDSFTRYDDTEHYQEVKVFIKLKQPSQCPNCPSTNIKKKYTRSRGGINHSYGVKVQKNKFDTNCTITLEYTIMECLECGNVFKEDNLLTQYTPRITDYTIVGALRSLTDLSRTYTSVANQFGMTPTRLQEIFDEHVETEYVPLSEVISIDEFYKKSSSQKYACTIMDYLNYKVIDVLQSRRKDYLESFLNKRSLEERSLVKFFIVDMYDTYHRVFGAWLPNGLPVVDSFHVVKNLQEYLFKVRTRIMNNTPKGTYNYLLLKSHFKFILIDKNEFREYKDEFRQVWWNHKKTPVHQNDLKEEIKKIDPGLARFIDLIDEYREFNKEYVGEDMDKVENKFDILVHKFKTKLKPEKGETKVKNQYPDEIFQCGKLLKRWKGPILNSFIMVTNDNGEVMRQSNAKIESLNGKIKANISQAMGIRNFVRFAKRIKYSVNFKPTFIKIQPIQIDYKNYHVNNFRTGKKYRKIK